MEPMIMLKKKITTAKFNFVLILMTLVYVNRWGNKEPGYVIFIIGHLIYMKAFILLLIWKAKKQFFIPNKNPGSTLVTYYWQPGKSI